MNSKEGMEKIFRNEIGLKTTFCRKKKYATRLAAIASLLYLKNKWAEKRENRAYFCRECQGWHLTKRGEHL